MILQIIKSEKGNVAVSNKTIHDFKIGDKIVLERDGRICDIVEAMNNAWAMRGYGVYWRKNDFFDSGYDLSYYILREIIATDSSFKIDGIPQYEVTDQNSKKLVSVEVEEKIKYPDGLLVIKNYVYE